jgi:hypothetical protein
MEPVAGHRFITARTASRLHVCHVGSPSIRYRSGPFDFHAILFEIRAAAIVFVSRPFEKIDLSLRLQLSGGVPP